MKKLNLILLVMVITAAHFSVQAQNNPAIKYFSGATDRVYGSGTLVGSQLFYGSIDGKLHCIDYESGRKFYQIDLEKRITTTPLSFAGKLLVVSGNDLVCYNPENQNIDWRFIPESTPAQAQLDEWDYHHSEPIIHGNQLYYGCGNGRMYVINPSTGDSIRSWSSTNLAPIRTKPVIVEQILYFGDWKGKVYAIDLESNTALWSSATWTGQDYDNFAGILSQIAVGDDYIYYGARNHNIHALNKTNGHIAWTYTSADGGWISGDPLIYEDLLLIAGSDNHKMLCFEALSGALKWEFQFPGNSFSQPIIMEDKIIFSTGNAYANTGTNYGRGFIHVLNLPDGSLYQEIELPGNCFSTPVRIGDKIFAGCDDKNLYAFDVFELTGISVSHIGHTLIQNNQQLHVYPNPSYGDLILEFHLEQQGDVLVQLLQLNGQMADQVWLKGLPAGLQTHKTKFELPAASQMYVINCYQDEHLIGTAKVLRE